jgi:type I restriction enzyme S subunit
MELNEVCEMIVDCEHKTAPTQETGYPSIRTPNIGRGHFILEGVNRVSEETYQLWTRRAVPQSGDLIMAREAPVGNVAMIPSGLQPCLGQRTLLIRPDRSKVEPSFLNYFLNGPHVQGLIHAKTNGATVAHLNMKDVRTMQLPELPPLPVQRRIAGILSAYDELMENSQRRIRLLEAMTRAIYREWFVHFRFPGHQKIKMVDSPLGKIPHGWEVKTVADSFEISGGGTPSRKEAKYWDDGTIQWFSPSDLTGAGTMFMDDSSDHITELGLAESSARLFPAFSVMLTSRATIGAIAINTHEACTNQGFITCLPNERVPIYFLFHWLTENVPQFERMASGATFKEISRGVFKTIDFLQPAPALVRRFESQVEPMGKQMLALQRQIQNLRRTRDLLLPRLLSGQVNLKEN